MNKQILDFIAERATNIEVSIESDPIDVTPLSQPDMSWEHKCKCGLTHRFKKDEKITNAKYEDKIYCNEEIGFQYPVSIPVCKRCGEELRPEYMPFTWRKFVPGYTTCTLNVTMRLEKEEAEYMAFQMANAKGEK